MANTSDYFFSADLSPSAVVLLYISIQGIWTFHILSLKMEIKDLLPVAQLNSNNSLGIDKCKDSF